MYVQVIGAMCSAKIPPREWAMDDGREGVSYKVELSDGTGNLKLNCIDEDIYNKFAAFERYNVQLELTAVSYEGRSGIKAVVTYAEQFNDSIDEQ